jgi:hypothetical protein
VPGKTPKPDMWVTGPQSDFQCVNPKNPAKMNTRQIRLIPKLFCSGGLFSCSVRK